MSFQIQAFLSLVVDVVVVVVAVIVFLSSSRLDITVAIDWSLKNQILYLFILSFLFFINLLLRLLPLILRLEYQGNLD